MLQVTLVHKASTSLKKYNVDNDWLPRLIQRQCVVLSVSLGRGPWGQLWQGAVATNLNSPVRSMLELFWRYESRFIAVILQDNDRLMLEREMCGSSLGPCYFISLISLLIFYYYYLFYFWWENLGGKLFHYSCLTLVVTFTHWHKVALCSTQKNKLFDKYCYINNNLWNWMCF